MWFMVCRWPQSQEGDWARPHLCKLGPWPVVTDSEVIVSDHLNGPYRAIGSVCVCVVSTFGPYYSFERSSMRCWLNGKTYHYVVYENRLV